MVNDYELVVRTAKELEWILAYYFGAQGRGLHDKISSVEVSHGLPPVLCRRMRYLATIRNKLIHERGFDAIPDRPRFMSEFEQSRLELDGLIAYREALRRREGAAAAGGFNSQRDANSSSYGCDARSGKTSAGCCVM